MSWWRGGAKKDAGKTSSGEILSDPYAQQNQTELENSNGGYADFGALSKDSGAENGLYEFPKDDTTAVAEFGWEQQENTVPGRQPPGAAAISQQGLTIGEKSEVGAATQAPSKKRDISSKEKIGVGGLICGINAIANGAQGFALGSVFGAMSGFMEAKAHQLPPQAVGQHTKALALQNAKELGLILSITSGVKCGMVQLRGTQDVLNSFVAGAAAGGVLAMRRGAPGGLIPQAAFFGFGMVIFDTIGSMGRPSADEAS